MTSESALPPYEVPVDIVEDPDELRVWMDKALAVARRKKSGASTRSRAGKGGRS